MEMMKDNPKCSNDNAKFQAVYVFQTGSSYIINTDHNSLQDIPSECRR